MPLGEIADLYQTVKDATSNALYVHKGTLTSNCVGDRLIWDKKKLEARPESHITMASGLQTAQAQ